MTQQTTDIQQNIYQNGSYLAENPDWHDGDGAWKARQIADFLARNRVRPHSVCDVGCGTGGVLRELSALLPGTARMVGFDTAPEPVEIGNRAARPPVELVVGDARDTDERFDLLLMVDVFEHVEDYLGFLRDFRNRAAHFVFHIPLDMTVQAVLRHTPIMIARRTVGHLHYFSRETALATLTDAGYRVLDESYTNGGIELRGTQAGRRFARLPRTVSHRLHPDLAARVLGGFSLLVLAESA